MPAAPTAAIELGIGEAANWLSGATTNVGLSQAMIDAVGQSSAVEEPGIGKTSQGPLALGVGLVWMEAFRQICFLVPSVGLDTCACTQRWDLSKLLNSHLSFLLVFIMLMFDAPANLHIKEIMKYWERRQNALFLTQETIVLEEKTRIQD
jgi:hypothetical protein